MARYANPEVLVETNWVKDNLGKPGIKLIEIDVDTKAYDAGHIPGAVGLIGRRNFKTRCAGTSSTRKLSRSSWGEREFRRMTA